MSPKLFLIRHAEALHNVNEELREMLDPPLSALGRKQAQLLGNSFPGDVKGMKIFSSPLRRALETSLIAFGSSIDPAVKIIAIPDAQEVGKVPCDTGSDIEILKTEFMESPVDLTLVPPNWENQPEDGDQHIQARAKRLRTFLASQETDVVLVTHGWFLYYLMDDWSELPAKGYGACYKNCECRAYRFLPDGEDFKLQCE